MNKFTMAGHPAIVKVQNYDSAQEILALCESHGWKVIIGIEPDKNEDISDVKRLLNPSKPVTSAKIDSNNPCPCGSGKKSKKCCYAN